MFTCRIENYKNDVLTLTQNESNFQVIDIQGLNPPNAQVNLSTIAGLDGARFNSSKLEVRNIVVYIRLNGDVEANRILLYKYFSTKECCKFYYKNGLRDVFIEAYVESVEVTPFTNNQVMQVSLVCPQPYFKNMDEIISDISKVQAAFKFPFSINIDNPIPVSTFETNRIADVYNDSETEMGVIVEVEVLGDINKILIRNTGTGETFTINNTQGFVSGDIITINTNKGEKSVTLSRDGQTINLFSYLVSGSKWFQLLVGKNSFSYLIDGGSNDDLVHIEFKYRSLYRGV